MKKKEKVSLLLDSESVESMRDEAEERGIEISDLYQEAIDDFIENKPEREFERNLEEQTKDAKTIPLDPPPHLKKDQTQDRGGRIDPSRGE